jgi:hypothetical protein
MRSPMPSEKFVVLSSMLILLLFATLPADAQTKTNEATTRDATQGSLNADSLAGTIKGKVKRKPEGGALPGATVTLRETGTGTTTDDDGNYSFNSVAANNYNLDVSKTLYLPETTQITVRPNRATEAPLVSLARKGRNLKFFVDLQQMYETNQIPAFERQVDLLSLECSDVADKDCKLIRQVDLQFSLKNEKKTRKKLTELVRFIAKVFAKASGS